MFVCFGVRQYNRGKTIEKTNKLKKPRLPIPNYSKNCKKHQTKTKKPKFYRRCPPTHTYTTPHTTPIFLKTLFFCFFLVFLNGLAMVWGRSSWFFMFFWFSQWFCYGLGVRLSAARRADGFVEGNLYISLCIMQYVYREKGKSLYIFFSLSLSIYIYIYICIEREGKLYISLYVYIERGRSLYLPLYIYIYIERGTSPYLSLYIYIYGERGGTSLYLFICTCIERG